MLFKLRLIPAATAAFLLAACGGGGSTSPTTPAVPTSGTAVDGYLRFAKAVCDSNGNGVADAGEAFVFTVASGQFTFPSGCTHGVLVTGGTSADTGLPFTGQLRAPAGAKMATPLTTLMVAGMTQAQVNTALGLPANTDLLNTDPALTLADGSLVNAELFKKTLAVQQLLQKTSELFAGLAGAAGSATLQPIYGEVAASFAATLKAGAGLSSIGTATDQSVVEAMVQAAALRAQTAPAVSAEVKAALTALNLPAMAKVAAGGMKLQADAILQSSNAGLTAVTTTQQSNEVVTDYIKSKKTDLSGTPQAAAVTAMGAALATLISTGAGIGSGGGAAGSALVSFDEATPVVTGMGAYGGALPEVVAAATGGDGKALKIVKPAGQEPWGGIYFGVPAIPFAADKKTITARVYATRAGAVIRFKVEVPGGASVEVASAPTGAANTWSTVSWDFSGVDLSQGYKTIAITPDPERTTDGQAYYIDDITLTASTVVAPPTSGGTVTSFDEATPVVTGMGAYGGALPEVVAAAAGGNGNALKIVKPAGQEPWGGIYFGVPAIPFAADKKTITARVYATRAGAVIRFKVEVPGGGNVEVSSAPTGAANTWSTVSWDFSGVDLSKGYKTIAITPDPERTTDGQAYYIDDIAVVAATVVVPPPTPTDYLAVVADTISLVNGAATTDFSMNQFQSAAGISVKWPLPSAATLRIKLAEVGTFNLAAGQKLSAALQITETVAGGQGEVRGYIDNVSVSKSGNSVQITIPGAASALVYGVSGNGQKKAIIDFANAVSGITHTLTTAAASTNSVLLGEVVNYAITNVSNDFTGINALRGKYKVALVVSDLPLRKADGSRFPAMSIEVPTALNASGATTASKPVTGWGLEGYITLTD